ncbi:E3 ubiquitin-protein ligase SlrP [Phycisphaerales bacterium]|nr:E3 ubiquitin-protein ligase SlrP [Phycisphaerales bacterium]
MADENEQSRDGSRAKEVRARERAFAAERMRETALQRIRDARQTGAELLNLSSLSLTTVPKELGELKALTTLFLHGNQITAVPKELGELKALTTLDLHNNQLTTVPKELGELKALTTLDLHNNQLTTVPKELGELQALTTLELHNNQITAVPKELGELKALTTLDLHNNQLTAVPKELGELKALTTLNLHNNQLTTVPKELGELQALTTLSLHGNRLTAVPKELGELVALTTLRLDHNQLAAVPVELGMLKALGRLDLDANRLTSVPSAIGRLLELRTLDLGTNLLTAVPKELGELKSLTTLYLNANHLADVPNELGALKALMTLDLSHNQLSAVPRELGEIKGLTGLFLHGNAALGLPPEVLGPTWREARVEGKPPARPAEILAYYLRVRGEDAAAAGPRPLNEAKVLVVGEPGVGKTMLVEWLTKGKAKKNPQWTKGIKILPWRVPGAKDDIKVSIWDFGGQEIMQATHQFFLTERSLYLLVLNSRENEEQSKIRYWLDKIRAFGADSPVIVVLNKRDEGQHEPDESRLRQDYAKNLRDRFFRTACKASKGVKAGSGVAELREAMAARIRQLDNVTQAVPAAFLAAKRAFEKESKAKKRMDRAAFDLICRNSGIDDDIGRDTLLAYLKSLGSLFHYKRGEQDHKTLVLDPEWLTAGVYKILTDHEVRDRSGVLTPKDVSRIFARSKTYTPEARDEPAFGEPPRVSGFKCTSPAVRPTRRLLLYARGG